MLDEANSSARTASDRCRVPRRSSVRLPIRRAGIRVAYLPAESDSGMFGGNSNWRGPIWMPVNALDRPRAASVLRILRQRLHDRMPTGSGRMMTLYQVAEEIRAAGEHLPERCRRSPSGLRRHARSFRRIRIGAICMLFYEYFHGDNGAGLGASHQTGWTGLIATLMQLFATRTAEQALEVPKSEPIPEPSPATSAAWRRRSEARRRHLRHLLLRVSVPRDSGWSALQSGRNRREGSTRASRLPAASSESHRHGIRRRSVCSPRLPSTAAIANRPEVGRPLRAFSAVREVTIR